MNPPNVKASAIVEPAYQQNGKVVSLRELDRILHGFHQTLPSDPLSLMIQRKALGIPVGKHSDQVITWWNEVNQEIPDLFGPEMHRYRQLFAPVVTNRCIYYVEAFATLKLQEGFIQSCIGGAQYVDTTTVELFTWGVRPGQLQWYDYITLFVVAQMLVPQKPEAIRLNVLALQEGKPATVFVQQGSKAQHRLTQGWLMQVMMKAEMMPGQAIDLPHPMLMPEPVTNIWDIEGIPEAMF